MSDFGSNTVIGPNIRLILLDCFETVVELVDGHYQARRGIIEFLTHFGTQVGIPMAIISDAAEGIVKHALTEAKVASYFVTVYHADNAAEDLGQGRMRKRLDRPLHDFNIPASQTMFIGDSPLDSKAAQHYGVHFIRVPRSEDKKFSFASLIIGPSRYRSQEFSVTFLEQFKNKNSTDK